MKPLLVVLHGDNGPSHIKKLERGFRDACEAHDLVCIFPACPHCPGNSFWQWKQSSAHDPGWLGAQIDAVPGVDPAHVYAAGYSGGATYLGWYVPTHPDRFAAVAYISGGMPWSGVDCSSCKTPVRFDIGAGDPMVVPYTDPLRKWFEGCGGHEVVWDALRGVSHEGMLDVLPRGRAEIIVKWLLDRTNACLLSAPLDAGAPSDSATPAPSAPPAPTPLPESAPTGDAPKVAAAPPPSGCLCSFDARASTPSFLLAALAITLVLGWRAAIRRKARSARWINTQRRMERIWRCGFIRRVSLDKTRASSSTAEGTRASRRASKRSPAKRRKFFM